MPTGMPANIAQGRVIEALGKKLTALTDAQRKQLRKALADGADRQSLRVIFETYLKPADHPDPSKYQEDLKHVFEHWFPSPQGNHQKHGGWWEEVQPIGRVVRAGLVNLIDLLDGLPNGHPGHVEAYWLCAGSHFEVVNCVSSKQITVLFLTPSPPFTRRRKTKRNNPSPGTDFEMIWVSKHMEYHPAEAKVDNDEVAGAITTRPEKPE